MGRIVATINGLIVHACVIKVEAWSRGNIDAIIEAPLALDPLSCAALDRGFFGKGAIRAQLQRGFAPVKLDRISPWQRFLARRIAAGETEYRRQRKIRLLGLTGMDSASTAE